MTLPLQSPCSRWYVRSWAMIDRASGAARLQRWRICTQLTFFGLFLLAPALNLLRFDAQQLQLWFLGSRWSLGLDALQQGQISATQAAWRLVWGAFVPGTALVGIFVAMAYRYGRLYCGWFCPHFSVVEQLNKLLHRACGRFSVWEREVSVRPDMHPHPGWWPIFVLSCVVMGFTWAITLMTYVLPPAQIWRDLLHGTLSSHQGRFLGVATLVLSTEFALARHLFCRFGCAVGLFQSLAWMANPRALVVAFERQRARECRTCESERSGAGSACDAVCPMRLNPRNLKRKMFACVQCGQCLRACASTQSAQGRLPTLQWQVADAAVRETLRTRDTPLDRAAEERG